MSTTEDVATVQRAARRLIRFLETGAADPALFTDDLLCDFTMPT